MDSKHFSSRSTTDNLPSSLSSPPGERAALSAASASPMDATTPTTSGGTTPPSHMPTVMTAGGENVDQPGTTAMTKPSCEPLQSPSDSDTCTSTSSDQSFDPKRDTSRCLSDSCSSLISVSSSITATFSSSTSSACNEEHITIAPQATSIQSSMPCGIPSAVDSNSSTKSTSNAAKPSGSNADTVANTNNIVISSNKNSAAKIVERGENQVDIPKRNDTSTQASANSNLPSTSANANTDAQRADISISCPSDRGVKRSRDEMEASSEESPTVSPQKNKKRCFICSCKLELAQRTIGRCRCDGISEVNRHDSDSGDDSVYFVLSIGYQSFMNVTLIIKRMADEKQGRRWSNQPDILVLPTEERTIHDNVTWIDLLFE